MNISQKEILPHFVKIPNSEYPKGKRSELLIICIYP